MGFGSKRGITVTSIMVYVLLFFAFTTVATVISSRFNKNLFDDRGNAINITAINKLEYNLLKSAENSYNADITLSENKKTLSFSNSDVYVFDNEENIIYKNGGKLVKFVKLCDVEIQENIINIDVTLNKYTNDVSRNIKIKCTSNISTSSYVQDDLIAQYDGIKNTSYGHDNLSTYWDDVSGNNVKGNFNELLISNNSWNSSGLLLEQEDSEKYKSVSWSYSGNKYSTMTIEFVMTFLSDIPLKDPIYPIYVYNSKGTTVLRLGIRNANTLMYYGCGSYLPYVGNNSTIEKGNKYTFTFVQEDLTTRAVYINGKLAERKTGLSLSAISLGQVLIQSNVNYSYIVQGLRIYGKALSEKEIVDNYNNDVLRFGK